MHSDQIEALARGARRRPLFDPDSASAVDLGRPAISRLVEHREPFLFVDRITHVDLQHRTIVGARRIDPGDPVFVGHFPSTPIYPGVLQIESLGQLGLCLFGLVRLGRTRVEPADAPHPVRGLRIHHALFLAPVGPGDELVMQARVLEVDEFTATAVGQLWCRDTVCCFAIMEVFFVDA
jgi:3-hydroxyacyl-[acyl-carrier-protein] dehydratase